jgi:hypothetical protein
MTKEKSEAFFIRAEHYCPSCSEMDYLRGPYETKDETERRKTYLTNNCRETHHAPTYETLQLKLERLKDGRIVINNTRVLPASRMKFIKVLPSGAIRGQQGRDHYHPFTEFFEGPEYWEPQKKK